MSKKSGIKAGIIAVSMFLALSPVSAQADAAVLLNQEADIPAIEEIGESSLLEQESSFTALAQTEDYITVYTEPDFESEQAGKLYDNNMVTIEEKEGVWYKIVSGNLEGYIVTDASIDDDPEAVGAIDEEDYTYGETTEEEQQRIAEEEKAAEEAARAAEEAAEKAAAEKFAEDQQAVADYALQFTGNPYVYGGSSLTHGTDCSGFVMSVYAHFGISLPHSSRSDRSVGTAVSEDDMQPGDIVCYSGHVALYIGDGQIVHASNARTGIIVSDVHYKNIICVRRVLSEQ